MNKFLAVIAVLLFNSGVFAQKTFTEPNKIFAGHTNDITQVTMTMKGDMIASGSWDKNINIYDSSYNLKRTLSGHTFPITSLRFRPDGKLLASGSSDNSIIIWDSLLRKSRTLDGHKDQINTLLFDKSNRYLFSGSDDRSLVAWDLASGKSFRKIEVGQPVTSLAQTNNQRFIYVAAGPQIKVYDLANGMLSKTFEGHADLVNSIAISNNNKLLLSGSNDKTARIWDLTTGKPIRALPVACWKVTSVAFSDDSKYAATGCNDGSLKIWEVETGKLIAQVEANGQAVKDICFAKNNMKLLVAATLKNNTEYGARLWLTGIEQIKPVTLPATLDSSSRKYIPLKNDSILKSKSPTNFR